MSSGGRQAMGGADAEADAGGASGATSIPPIPGTSCDHQLTFADALVEEAVRAAAGLGAEEDIFLQDTSTVTSLNLSAKFTLSSLEGLQCLKELTYLNLVEDSVADVTPLRTLRRLTYLELGDNEIVDISALASLEELEYLGLGNWFGAGENAIEDVSALEGLEKLKNVHLAGLPIDCDESAELLDLLAARCAANGGTLWDSCGHIPPTGYFPLGDE